MRLLLDTQVLIWSVVCPERLSGADIAMVHDSQNEVLFSTASIWEFAIKFGLRRSDFTVDPAELAEAARLDFSELPVTSSAAIRVVDLPHIHRDPFDRLLVAQAIDANAALLIADAALAAYGSHVLMLGSVPTPEA